MKSWGMKKHHDDIKLMFERNLTYREMAMVIDCSELTISKTIEKLNLTRERLRKAPYGEKENSQIIELFHDGVAYKKIAEIVGVSLTYAKNTIYKNGLRRKEATKKKELSSNKLEYKKVLSMKW